MPSKNKRFAEFARVVALAPRALYSEFDPSYAEAEGESGDEWDDHGSDYDSDDNTTSAQVHRFFAPRWRRPASTYGTIIILYLNAHHFFPSDFKSQNPSGDCDTISGLQVETSLVCASDYVLESN